MNRALMTAIVLVCLGVPPALVIATGLPWYVDHRRTGAVTIDGEAHDYVVHVPNGYDGSKPVPLVLSLHGAASWPSFQQDVTGWNELADQHGFIVSYPGGTGSALKVFSPRDSAFIAALLDQLEASYKIDRSRIYVNGLSNGGGMSDILSCTLRDRIAAIGAVAPALSMTSQACESAGPMPMIVFHGTADPITRYHGGKVFASPDPFPDIPDWLSTWAARNQCAASPTESNMTSDVTRVEYRDCAAPVILYRIEGGGHTWPGGVELPVWFTGRTTHSINASRLMWEFFAAHAQNR